MTIQEDYSTLPEEFENKRWKCSIVSEESTVEYEYSAITFNLVYDCTNKESEDIEPVTIKSHVEFPTPELDVYNLFGTYLLGELEVLERLNHETR